MFEYATDSQGHLCTFLALSSVHLKSFLEKFLVFKKKQYPEVFSSVSLNHVIQNNLKFL
jgi:hypothetical protein